MPTVEEAKAQLDRIIGLARGPFYKPIQIAEVLYRIRIVGDIAVDDPESYRTASKHWRDSVSQRLVGRISTSSSRFQDNVFEGNAIPLDALRVLDEENRRYEGAIEKYIYLRFQQSQSVVGEILAYVESATRQTFILQDFFSISTVKRRVEA